ncbi:MFS transporter [Calidifontibacter sp. DB0510]|uniref:Putative proline/betaine transporter n=1 Tax=Metallococcus carri TaxID=1656884 RepID=A0A967EBV8_9MICO|nr:MFS transporter [Metallococcus carri]NHN57379.1 MFS transporter [Metallococcus carri]NOP39157.1 MFS transporter [Calidifontibacter sp. DB2511S]
MTTNATAAAPPRTRSRVRQLAAASAGNAIEWYDWYAYSFLATTFGPLIFPSKSDIASTLGAFAVFAVGFFMRPIGGLLLGAIADRHGRRFALTATILLMGLGSLLVGITPTFASAGILAPIMLVVGRLISGLSIGGEFAASTTFLVESAPPNRRGLFASFQYVSTAIGQLCASGLAALLVTVLSKEAMTSWGWRVPFLLGTVVTLFALWLRRGIDETHDVSEKNRPKLFDAIRHYPKQSLLVCGITLGGTIAYYAWTTYLPTYAQQSAGFSKSEALTVSTISLAFFGLIQPLGGMISDRIGRKPMLLVFAGGFVVLIVPLLRLIGDAFWSLLAVSLAGMALLTCYTSIAAAVNAETIPARVRASGIGFPYSVTVAAFGGTAPYLGTWLASKGHGGLFPLYVAMLCAISFVVYFLMPERSKEPLR